MSTFKDYLVECIIGESVVVVKNEHMATMTLIDICMLIHYLSESDTRLFLSDGLLTQTIHDEYFHDGVIYFDEFMTEKLALLLCIFGKGFFGYNQVELVDRNTGEKRVMSGDIIDVAASCGMKSNKAILYIQQHFIMSYEIVSVADYFENYCQQRQAKSARNIG